MIRLAVSKLHQAFYLVGAIVALSFVVPSVSAAEWDEFLQRIPDSANAVVVVDVEALRASPLGIIKSARRTNAVRREFNKLLIGSIVSTEGLEPEWQVAVVKFPAETEADLDRFAERVGSKVSELAGYETVATPSGAYVAQLSSHLIAGLSPATRQSAARWLREQSDGTQISPYLRKAVERGSKEGQIVAALDLKDLRSAREIEERLQTEYEFAVNKLNTLLITVPELARFLASVEGMTFTMNVGTGVSGRLRIDFGLPAVILETSGAGKKLVMEVLKDMGAWLDDFERWEESSEGNSYILEGRLAITSAQEVMASFEIAFDSSFVMPAEETGAESDKSETELQLEATQAYFQGLTDRLERLKSYKGGNAGQYASRYRREAGKIEKLPTLRVDPELLDFGAETSANLRKVSRMIKGARSRAYVQQASVGMRNRYSNWRSGRGSLGNRAIAVQLVPMMTVMDEVDAGITEMRRSMTEKYQVQF